MKPYTLKRGEGSFLTMLACNRTDPKARGLIDEFKDKLSPEVIEIAEAVISLKPPPPHLRKTVTAIRQRADARNAKESKPLTVKEARQARGTYLDIIQVEAKLAALGNGIAISYWNGTYDINLLEPGLTLSSRRILASGEAIDKALFERAEKRIGELKSGGAIWRGPHGWVMAYTPHS